MFSVFEVFQSYAQVVSFTVIKSNDIHFSNINSESYDEVKIINSDYF